MLIMLILISIWIAVGIIFRKKLEGFQEPYYCFGFCINFILFFILFGVSTSKFLEIESSKTYNLSLINNSFFVRSRIKDGLVKYNYAYIDDAGYLNTKEMITCKIVKDVLPTVTIISWKSSLGWWGFGSLKSTSYIINVPINALSNIEVFNNTVD